MAVDGAVVVHSWAPGEEGAGDAARKKNVSASLLDTSARHRETYIISILAVVGLGWLVLTVAVVIIRGRRRRVMILLLALARVASVVMLWWSVKSQHEASEIQSGQAHGYC